MDDDSGRGGGRVRKKSAKLIEMEESEAFEKKLMNRKPKKPRCPLAVPPKPQTPKKAVKSPKPKPEPEPPAPTPKASKKTAKKDIENIAAESSDHKHCDKTDKLASEGSGKVKMKVTSPPAQTQPPPVDITQAQFTSTPVAGTGGLKLKFGLEMKKEVAIPETEDTVIDTSPTPSSPAKKKSKKRKKEQVDSSDMDDVEVTHVKMKKKKKVKNEEPNSPPPRPDSEKNDSRSASALLAALAAAPAPPANIISKTEAEPSTDKHSPTVTKVKVKKRTKSTPPAEISNAGLLGPVMKPEECSSEDEDEFSSQFDTSVSPGISADVSTSVPSPLGAVRSPPAVCKPENGVIVESPDVGASMELGKVDTVVGDVTNGVPGSINETSKKIKVRKDKVKKKRGRKPKSEERKEKRKRRPTAYTMWCNSYRPKVIKANPGIDFAAISRRLGEIWQAMPYKEKMCWRRKAKKMITKGSQLITTGKKAKLLSSKTGSQEHGADVTDEAGTPNASSSHARVNDGTAKSEFKLDPSCKVSCNPVDVAAHLKLLGESLSIIGTRLQEHRGQIAVQGSLSVLLDSLLCSLAPLTCLCNQVPELTDSSILATQADTINNIAYVMPGIA